mgnify:CR=1 FL=1
MSGVADQVYTQRVGVVKGIIAVHTNTIESVWSLFKRGLIGSYHRLSAKHLQAYFDEMAFRYNNRRSRFLFRDTLLRLLRSDNLSYRELIEENA